jgi:hypothetical protein
MGRPVVFTGTYSPQPTAFFTFPHAGKAFSVSGSRPFANPHAGNEFFSAWGNGKGLSPGTGRLFWHGGKKNVSLQDPEGFTGIGD